MTRAQLTQEIEEHYGAADEDIRMLLDQSFELTAAKGWHDKRKSLEETVEWL